MLPFWFSQNKNSSVKLSIQVSKETVAASADNITVTVFNRLEDITDRCIITASVGSVTGNVIKFSSLGTTETEVTNIIITATFKNSSVTTTITRQANRIESQNWLSPEVSTTHKSTIKAGGGSSKVELREITQRVVNFYTSGAESTNTISITDNLESYCRLYLTNNPYNWKIDGFTVTAPNLGTEETDERTVNITLETTCHGVASTRNVTIKQEANTYTIEGPDPIYGDVIPYENQQFNITLPASGGTSFIYVYPAWQTIIFSDCTYKYASGAEKFVEGAGEVRHQANPKVVDEWYNDNYGTIDTDGQYLRATAESRGTDAGEDVIVGRWKVVWEGEGGKSYQSDLTIWQQYNRYEETTETEYGKLVIPEDELIQEMIPASGGSLTPKLPSVNQTNITTTTREYTSGSVENVNTKEEIWTANPHSYIVTAESRGKEIGDIKLVSNETVHWVGLGSVVEERQIKVYQDKNVIIDFADDSSYFDPIYIPASGGSDVITAYYKFNITYSSGATERLSSTDLREKGTLNIDLTIDSRFDDIGTWDGNIVSRANMNDTFVDEQTRTVYSMGTITWSTSLVPDYKISRYIEIRCDIIYEGNKVEEAMVTDIGGRISDIPALVSSGVGWVPSYPDGFDRTIHLTYTSKYQKDIKESDGTGTLIPKYTYTETEWAKDSGYGFLYVEPNYSNSSRTTEGVVSYTGSISYMGQNGIELTPYPISFVITQLGLN